MIRELRLEAERSPADHNRLADSLPHRGPRLSGGSPRVLINGVPGARRKDTANVRGTTGVPGIRCGHRHDAFGCTKRSSRIQRSRSPLRILSSSSLRVRAIDRRVEVVCLLARGGRRVRSTKPSNEVLVGDRAPSETQPRRRGPHKPTSRARRKVDGRNSGDRHRGSNRSISSRCNTSRGGPSRMKSGVGERRHLMFSRRSRQPWLAHGPLASLAESEFCCSAPRRATNNGV